MCSARSMFLPSLLAATVGVCAGADRYYVNANNSPTDPNHPSWGTDWAHAHTNLQEALARADEGDEIWVAKSTPAQPAYFPSVRYPDDPNDPNDPRRVTFRIPAGVRVYGGFRGYDHSDPNHPYDGEAELALRDPDHNLTILDGDIEQNDDPNQFPFGSTFADNAYHVVFIHGTSTVGDAPTKLSGFVIRNGYADGLDEDSNPAGQIPDDMGGGILSFANEANHSGPRLDRLIFDRNYADVAGAGILVAGKLPTAMRVAASSSTGSATRMTRTCPTVTVPGWPCPNMRITTSAPVRCRMPFSSRITSCAGPGPAFTFP